MVRDLNHKWLIETLAPDCEVTSQCVLSAATTLFWNFTKHFKIHSFSALFPGTLHSVLRN